MLQSEVDAVIFGGCRNPLSRVRHESQPGDVWPAARITVIWVGDSCRRPERNSNVCGFANYEKVTFADRIVFPSFRVAAASSAAAVVAGERYLRTSIAQLLSAARVC